MRIINRFECNVPFRVNIPFPISMKNLFGSQLFEANSKYQIHKALVPDRKLQKDSKLEWSLSFSMRPALPPSDLQSSNSSTKATTFTKKKGLRRGNKAFPCETSTQTIEEESDPVLICLEQIRSQLANKTPEGLEKNISRCFAEKSTNVVAFRMKEMKLAWKILSTHPQMNPLNLKKTIKVRIRSPLIHKTQHH